MKKLISIALVLAMVLAILPVAALAAPATGNYYVCGPVNLTGTNWSPNSVPNRMTKNGTVYTKVYSNLAAGDYEFRITRGNMSQFWGENGSSVKFTNGFPADVTITFEPATEKITVTGAGIGAVAFVADSITAVGAGSGGFLNNANWDPAASTNHMTNNDGVWTIEYPSVAAGTYEFKFAANDSWNDNWGYDGIVANDTWVDAVFNSATNAQLTVEHNNSKVTLSLDLNTYNSATGTGAKMMVNVVPQGDFETTVAEGTKNLLSDSNSESEVVTFKPVVDGILTITFGTCTPGWAFVVNYPDGSSSLLKSGSDNEPHAYEVKAGETYEVQMFAYSPAAWGFADGSISYKITFKTGTLGQEAEKEEYAVSDTKLVLGDNAVTTLDTAVNTLFEFEPTETGVYTFTAPAGVLLGNWNVPAFPNDLYGDSKTNVVEWTCSGVGQTVLIGSTEDTTITIVKKAEVVEKEEIVYEDYVNVHTPSEDYLINLDEKEPTDVDITKPQTVVKGEDGLYHMGTADGPLVFVNLVNDGFNIIQAFSGGYGALAMRGKYTDDSGDKYYDFLNAMSEYADVISNADNDNCLYPLTDDLVIFLKAYGAYQGWFDADKSPYEAVQGEHNADSAWLVCCCYLEDVVSSEGTQESPDTGDMSFMPFAVVMVLAAAAVIVLVPAKKKFF